METEVNLEPFVRAERLPAELPWAAYRAADSRSGHIVRLSVMWGTEHLGAERVRAGLDWFAEAGYQAQRLTSPALPGVLSYRSDGESAFVATDFPDGRPLREILAMEGPLPVARAMYISSVIAGVLAQAHAVGWAHGWLTPDTVWLSEDTVVTVTDLGLGLAAQTLAPGNPTPYTARAGFFAGDPLRRDLQCLGLLLTDMLTGRLPDPVGVPRGDIYPDEVPGGVVARIRALVNPQVESPMSAAEWASFARVGESKSQAELALKGEDEPAEAYYEAPVRPQPWRQLTWPLGVVVILAAGVFAGSRLRHSQAPAPPSSGAVRATSAAPPPDAPPSPAATATAASPEALTRVQVGPIAPADQETAAARLRQMGFDPYLRREGSDVYIQVGAFANAEGAKATQEQLQRAGFSVRILP